MNGLAELCSLLNERGVEWQLVDDEGIAWVGPDGSKYRARLGATLKGPDGTVSVFGMTPEQAIEATLGRGTCRAVSMRERDKRPYLKDEQVCSECGCQLAHEFDHVWQNYCPNCGRRIG